MRTDLDLLVLHYIGKGSSLRNPKNGYTKHAQGMDVDEDSDECWHMCQSLLCWHTQSMDVDEDSDESSHMCQSLLCWHTQSMDVDEDSEPSLLAYTKYGCR